MAGDPVPARLRNQSEHPRRDCRHHSGRGLRLGEPAGGSEFSGLGGGTAGPTSVRSHGQYGVQCMSCAGASVPANRVARGASRCSGRVEARPGRSLDLKWAGGEDDQVEGGREGGTWWGASESKRLGGSGSERLGWRGTCVLAVEREGGGIEKLRAWRIGPACKGRGFAECWRIGR
jgi:hypothetical protein